MTKHFIKKLLSTSCISILLLSCASVEQANVSETKSRSLMSQLQVPLFATLSEVDDGYEFTDIGFGQNKAYQINLRSGEPTWDISKTMMCSYGLAIKKTRFPDCDDPNNFPPFYEAPVTVGTVAGYTVVFALTMGMSTFMGSVEYEFNEDKFNEALENAYSKININESDIVNFKEYKSITGIHDFEELNRQRNSNRSNMPTTVSNAIDAFLSVEHQEHLSVRSLSSNIKLYLDSFKLAKSDLDGYSNQYAEMVNQQESMLNAQRVRYEEKRKIESERAAEEMREFREKQLAREQNENKLKSKVGTQICKKVDGIYIYIGYVENVVEDKIKISISDARAEKGFRLRPPGFQPTTIWDYPDNWYVCE
jgi:hypothetical protein